MRPQQVCPFSVLKEAPLVWTAKNIRFLVGCAHNVGALKTKFTKNSLKKKLL